MDMTYSKTQRRAKYSEEKIQHRAKEEQNTEKSKIQGRVKYREEHM